MDGGMVSLSHYMDNALSGFGATNQYSMDMLKKALETGYAIVNQTGGAALRVQSLEGSLKVLTFNSSHIKLWRKIPKSPAYSTNEEYNQLVAYGAQGRGAFVREGELPTSSDSSYVRRSALVKFMGTTREVTHQATLVNQAHGDVVALENHNGILYILQQVEEALYGSDASLAFDGESEGWDGLDALTDISSYVDLEDNPIQETDIEEASNLIIENYGFPTDMFLGTRTMSDLVKVLYPRQRIQLPAPVMGQIGMSVGSIATQGGVVQFNPDVFVRVLPSPSAAQTDPRAPAAVQTIADGGVLAAGSAEWTKQIGSVVADVDFTLAVVASNRFGDSAPAFQNVTVLAAEWNANQAMEIDITTALVIGANPPEYYKIYRTRPGVQSVDVADFSLILKVPTATQAANTTQLSIAVDRNFLIPFTAIAYLGQLDPQVLTFRQLAPMMKMDLAVTSPAYRWMILMYGTPILFTPKKWVRLINIARLN